MFLTSNHICPNSFNQYNQIQWHQHILENSYKVSTKCCLDKHIKELCKIEVLANMWKRMAY